MDLKNRLPKPLHLCVYLQYSDNVNESCGLKIGYQKYVCVLINYILPLVIVPLLYNIYEFLLLPSNILYQRLRRSPLLLCSRLRSLRLRLLLPPLLFLFRFLDRILLLLSS